MKERYRYRETEERDPEKKTEIQRDGDIASKEIVDGKMQCSNWQGLTTFTAPRSPSRGRPRPHSQVSR